jgi:predicted nucleotidyltransferase
MDLPPDFSDLLAEFARAGVEFVVVGGYAVAFHGTPRATKDIDLLLRGTRENQARAAAALARFGAPGVVVDAVRDQAPTDVVFMGSPPLRVDLLLAIDGVDLDRVFERAVESRWGDAAVRVIGLDDLIANKRAAGRPQDRVDAELLERARAATPGRS